MIESPSDQLQSTQSPSREFARPLIRETLQAVGVFLALWLLFYGLYLRFPYLRTGSGSIYIAKEHYEFTEHIFPVDPHIRRVLIFGTSKVLAGFQPVTFDRLASDEGIKTFSFNSGYPAMSEFVPQLAKIVARGNMPDILLLTNPWTTPKKRTLFQPLPGENDLARMLFPFRYFPRDALSFWITSREHGGVKQFYLESERNITQMLLDRGYYFISEQSHFPHDQLPDDFHLNTDDPDKASYRVAEISSPEFVVLKQTIEQNKIQCFFVPQYARAGERAVPPPRDSAFADKVELNSSCKVLGPDYFVYPNRYFSDNTHLNRVGAKVYTEDLYRLLSPNLKRIR